MGYRTIVELGNGAPDLYAERVGELHDVNDHESDSDTKYAWKIIPGNLPWCGIPDTDFAAATTGGTAQNFDRVPVQYEHHSNTKSHQLGGIYESYSVSG